MDVGALSLLISESGFSATMQKVAQLDSAAAKVGARPAEVKVTAPSVAPVTQSLSRLQQQAATLAGTPVAVRVTVPGVEATTRAIDALGDETQETEQQARSGAAAWVAYGAALANAQRAMAAARAAQAAAPAVQPSALNPVPTPGQRELGPATAKAEAFAQRTAAFKAETAAIAEQAQVAQQAARAKQQLAVTTTTAGNAAQGMSPKVRSAANGIAAMSFAASSGTPNMQSFSLAAGLAGSSLADAFGPGKIASYASGIGALIVLTATAVAIYQRYAQATSAAATNQRRVLSAPDLESAQRRYDQLTRSLEGLRREREALASKPLVTTTIAEAFRLQQLSNEVEAFEKAQNEAFEGLTDRRREQARAVAAAQREAAVSAANDQLRITQSLIDRQESLNAQGYALGQIRLDDYFQAREEIVTRRSEAIVRALEAERRALSVAPVGETPDEAIARTAQRDSKAAEIEAELNRRRTAQQSFMAERESAERALAQRLAGFERQRLEAQGRTHEARLAQIEQEAEEFQRALGQQGTLSPQAQADTVRAFRAALTAQSQFNEAQRESQRIFAELGAERERIQQRIETGQVTEMQGQRQIAQAERDRLPALQRIAASMLAFATTLQNPELLAAAQALAASLGSIGRAPLTAGQEWVRDVKNSIERQFQLQEILLQPKNIKLAGVDQALGQMNQQLSSLALNLGNTIGSSLAAGFSAAFTKGSGKNFAEAFGNALLQSVGGVMVQLGSSMLAYAAIMTVAAPLLALTPFAGASIGAAQAAITGATLVALGAGMGAIAANNSGSRTGGGAARGGISNPATIPNERVVLDPDRRLREREAVAPRVADRSAARAVAHDPFIFAPTIIGPNDPVAQRQLAAMVRGADSRNIPTTRRRR